MEAISGSLTFIGLRVCPLSTVIRQIEHACRKGRTYAGLLGSRSYCACRGVSLSVLGEACCIDMHSSGTAACSDEVRQELATSASQHGQIKKEAED